MTILVTGAAGFIGATVARRLTAAGRAIVGTDRQSPETGVGFPFVLSDVRDIRRHLAVVLDACEGIIHCGAISGPMLGRDDPAMVIETNVMGTTQLLELTRLFRLRRMVACSSVSAYGATPDGAVLVTEETPLSAWDIYGASKAAGDLAVQAFARQCGVDAVSLRLGWVYGPGRRTDGVLHPMIRSALGGPAYDRDAGGEQPIQFVHADDVADALIAAFDAPRLPRLAYNVTAGPRLDVAGIATLVREILPAARIRVGAGRFPDEPYQAEISVAAAREDLGWVAKVPLQAGIAAYAEWLRDHDV